MAGTKYFIKLNKKCNLKDQLELEKKWVAITKPVLQCIKSVWTLHFKISMISNAHM